MGCIIDGNQSKELIYTLVLRAKKGFAFSPFFLAIVGGRQMCCTRLNATTITTTSSSL